jgi:cell division protein FtsL
VVLPVVLPLVAAELVLAVAELALVPVLAVLVPGLGLVLAPHHHRQQAEAPEQVSLPLQTTHTSS